MRQAHPTDIKRNRLIYLVANIGGHLYVLVTLPVLTGYLSPEHFGFYIILVQIAAVGQAANMAIFANALLRFYADYVGEERRRFVGTVMLAFVGLQSLIAVLLYYSRHEWVHIVFPNITVPLDPYFLYAMGWMTLLSSRGIALTFIKTVERPSLVFAQVLLYGALLVPTLYQWVVIENAGLLGALRSLIIAEFGTFAFMVFWLRREAKLEWHFRFIKRVAVFCGPLFLSSMFLIAFSNVDRIVLSHYVTLEQLGVYGIGFIVGNIAGLVVTANNSAYSPRLLKVMKEEGDAAAKSLSAYFMKDSFSLLALAVAGLTVFNDLFVSYLSSGTATSAGSMVVVGIAAGHLVRSQFLFIRHGLFSKNKTGMILALNIILVLIGASAADLLARGWGLYGVAFMSMFAHILVIPLALGTLRRQFSLSLPGYAAFKAGVLIAIFVCCELYLEEHSRQVDSYEYWLIKAIEVIFTVVFYGKYMLSILQPLQLGISRR